MTSTTPGTTSVRRFGTTAAVLCMIGLVAFPPRRPLYETLAGASADHPGLHGVLTLVATRGLLALIAIVVVVAVLAWRRSPEHFLLLVATGVGTAAAYASSETIKLLVTEQRPCRASALETVMACPATSDWSWPSNHATIATALAVSCLVVLPKAWPLVVPLALLIALSRVLVGVHYVHDVAAGAVLGIVVTLLVTHAAAPLVGRVRASPRCARSR